MEIFSVTIPIFLFLIIGYTGKKKGYINDNIKNFISKLIYYIAMPCLIFRSIASFDFSETFRIDLVGHNLLTTTVLFIVTFFAALKIRNKNKRGAFHMGCFRSNQGYMGLPVIMGFFGSEAVSKAAVINGFDSPFVIFISVFALEFFKGQNKDSVIDKKEFIKITGRKLLNFLKNPFFIAAASAMLFSYFQIHVLDLKIFDRFLETAEGMALPLALISIGCSIDVERLRGNISLVASAGLIKLIIMPVTAFLLAWFLFGLRGVDLGLAVILTSNPTSVSSYIMAAEMKSDEELMATIIGVTTFASVVTITAIQYILSSFVY